VRKCSLFFPHAVLISVFLIDSLFILHVQAEDFANNQRKLEKDDV
jgi:hypothetical protein